MCNTYEFHSESDKESRKDTTIKLEPYPSPSCGVGLLGCANASDSYPGKLKRQTEVDRLVINVIRVRGYYAITLFQSSAFSGPKGEASAFVDIV